MDRVQFSKDQESFSLPKIGQGHTHNHAQFLLGPLSRRIQQLTLLWYFCKLSVVSTSCVLCGMFTATDGALFSSSMRTIATFSVISLSLSSFVLLNSNGLLFLLLLAEMFEIITHQQWAAVLALVSRNVCDYYTSAMGSCS
jgi:hypothetical protein